MHRRTEFEVTVAAPYEVVAPLFGAHRERVWAEGWNPRFMHPTPAADVGGSVFTVEGPHPSVWINTVYDLQRGHVQYAAFVPDAMVTLIDIRLRRTSAEATHASVVYERTALRSEADEHVSRLADGDSAKGPQWSEELGAYVRKAGRKAP